MKITTKSIFSTNFKTVLNKISLKEEPKIDLIPKNYFGNYSSILQEQLPDSTEKDNPPPILDPQESTITNTNPLFYPTELFPIEITVYNLNSQEARPFSTPSTPTKTFWTGLDSIIYNKKTSPLKTNPFKLDLLFYVPDF